LAHAEVGWIPARVLIDALFIIEPSSVEISLKLQAIADSIVNARMGTCCPEKALESKESLFVLYKIGIDFYQYECDARCQGVCVSLNLCLIDLAEVLEMFELTCKFYTKQVDEQILGMTVLVDKVFYQLRSSFVSFHKDVFVSFFELLVPMRGQHISLHSPFPRLSTGFFETQ
jgi:hypothetical protein